ncbi:hypothetical protein [Hymenobacter sp. AT01-02]|uniref:hypothetical protein n=1 Tax=Hymenobacter sp. AT01-02 TaxID=1571877 RepID=UPI000AA7C711|nr:hypothetical protein [Hymenobacter sp. AT01-02]
MKKISFLLGFGLLALSAPVLAQKTKVKVKEDAAAPQSAPAPDAPASKLRLRRLFR